MSFNLTANVIIKDIQNLNSTAQRIRQAFGRPIDLSISAGSLHQATKEIESTSKAVQAFSHQAGLAARRFFSFILASGAIYSLKTALTSSFKQIVFFDRQMIRLSQVAETNVENVKVLGEEAIKLGRNLGVGVNDIVKVAVTLKQAGFGINDTKVLLSAIAKTTLAPTFKDVADTTEGVIAIMQQFAPVAGRAGISVNKLEEVLGSINRVSADFAVESDDIVAAIKRAGSAFRESTPAYISGQEALEKFIAIFSAVRSATRESPETIATGLRTIFTRLQRPTVVSKLEEMGIKLRLTREEAEKLGDVNLEGSFVGPYEAIRRINIGLQGVSTTSEKFSRVIEQIGGARQVNKTIAAIIQQEQAEKALMVAKKGRLSLDVETAAALEQIFIKMQKVKNEYIDLAIKVGETKSFRLLVDAILSMATAFANLGKAVAPLIPFLLVFAGIKIGSILSGALSSIRGIFLPPIRKQRGGIVPGVGSGDTVPALLESGEFVIKKSAARSLGYKYLNYINNYGNVIPALLEPGEFVINKSSAKDIGVNTLNRLNNIGRYQHGGLVRAFNIGGLHGKVVGVSLSARELDSLEYSIFRVARMLKLKTENIVDKIKQIKIEESLPKAFGRTTVGMYKFPGEITLAKAAFRKKNQDIFAHEIGHMIFRENLIDKELIRQANLIYRPVRSRYADVTTGSERYKKYALRPQEIFSTLIGKASAGGTKELEILDEIFQKRGRQKLSTTLESYARYGLSAKYSGTNISKLALESQIPKEMDRLSLGMIEVYKRRIMMANKLVDSETALALATNIMSRKLKSRTGGMFSSTDLLAAQAVLSPSFGTRMKDKIGRIWSGAKSIFSSPMTYALPLAIGGTYLAQSIQESYPTTAGVIGGAAAGLSIGTMFGPFGMAIGAAAGALIGLASASSEAAEKIAIENKARRNIRLGELGEVVKTGRIKPQDIVEFENLLKQEYEDISRYRSTAEEIAAPIGRGMAFMLTFGVSELTDIGKTISEAPEKRAHKRADIYGRSKELSKLIESNTESTVAYLTHLTEQRLGRNIKLTPVQLKKEIGRTISSSQLRYANIETRDKLVSQVFSNITQKQFRLNQVEFENRIENFIDKAQKLSDGIDIVTERFNSLSNVVDGTVSIIQGGFSNLNFKQISQDLKSEDYSKVSRSVNVLGDMFGIQYQRFGREFEKYEKAKQIIQDVTERSIKLRGSSVEARTVVEDISRELEARGISGDIFVDKALEQIEKLDNIYDAFHFGDIKNITERETKRATEALKQVFIKSGEAIEEGLTQYSNNVLKIANLTEKIIQYQDQQRQSELEATKLKRDITASREGDFNVLSRTRGTEELNLLSQKISELTGLAIEQTFNPEIIGQKIEENLSRLRILEKESQRQFGLGNIQQSIGLVEQFNILQQETKQYQQALELLSNVTQNASSLQQKLNDIRQKEQAQISAAAQFLFSTRGERRKILRGEEIFKQVSEGLNLNTLSRRQLDALNQFLQTRGETPFVGTELTVRERFNQLIVRDMEEMAEIPANFRQMRNRIEENLLKVIDIQSKAAAEQSRILQKQQEDLFKTLKDGFLKLINDLRNIDIFNKSEGGFIPFMARGGLFKPRGTDIVPAMLTPGEFVVNRKSAQANKSLLVNINNARGPLRLQGGGLVREPQMDPMMEDFVLRLRRREVEESVLSKQLKRLYVDQIFRETAIKKPEEHHRKVVETAKYIEKQKRKILERRLGLSGEGILGVNISRRQRQGRLLQLISLMKSPIIKKEGGGLVPGFGFGDYVETILSPGEYVLSKKAVRNIGINNLQYLQEGGEVVRGNDRVDRASIIRNLATFDISMRSFSVSTRIFSNSANNLANALKSIPNHISLEGKHEVNIIVNGVEAFNKIMPEVQKLIDSATKNAINKLIRDKFPDVGNQII